MDATVIDCRVRRVSLGSHLSLAHESVLDGQVKTSTAIGPTVNQFFLFRLGEAEYLKKFAEGTRHQAYYDKTSGEVFIEVRRYDFIDRIFSVFFLIMAPVMMVTGAVGVALGLIMIYLKATQ